LTGSNRSITAFRRLKIAVFAPIPGAKTSVYETVEADANERLKPG
jgi:hypothetical protein